MLPTTSDVKTYVQEVLGLPVAGAQPLGSIESLPYFLRDTFVFDVIDLCGHQVLLLLDQGAKKLPAKDLRLWVSKARDISGLSTVYVTDALASYQRKRLIEQKVPFIVPGNQLYLPDLGLDLREYFRHRPSHGGEALSPSAQLLLIQALLRPDWRAAWHPVEEMSRLGYTPMTVSRAIRDLVAAGIAQTHKQGRTHELVLPDAPAVTWARALPLLRSPVQRVVWLEAGALSGQSWPFAGGSALARLSMINAPRNEVRAIRRADWLKLQPSLKVLPEPSAGAIALQVWNYPPDHQQLGHTVDWLSLILSLKDEQDERIQLALDELKGRLPW